MSTEVFVARQPIFDVNKNLVAYELLFRSNLENYFDLMDGDQATTDVINTSFFFIGIKQLTGGKRASINFTQNLLLNGVASLFPADQIIIEILESVEPEEKVLSMCEQLKKLGYTIALDDFMPSKHRHPFVRYADIVKVDFADTAVTEQQRIPDVVDAPHVKFLAEKVETVEEFQQAQEWGYSLFQGYFFSRPVISKGHSIPSVKLNYLNMLREIHKPEIQFDEMEEIIKRDLAMTYKLLRMVNSAFIGLTVEVKSIKQALVLLGINEVKKWASLIALEKLAEERPQELIYRSIVRARFCENIAPEVHLEMQASELFLTGMFTTLDAIIDMPMADVLEDLPLATEIKSALLGGDNAFRHVLDIVLAYESGEWEQFTQSASALDLGEHKVPGLFGESVAWADQILMRG